MSSDPSPLGLAAEVESLMNMSQNLCKQRGICCRVAVFKGLHNWETLLEMTQQDDMDGEMARDFASVFLPFSNHEEVRAIAPDFVDSALERAYAKGMRDEEVGFYHCRYVSDDGRCSVHEDRPIGCRKYPLPHPNTLFHPGCGYEGQAKENWKRVLEILTMLGIADQYT
jgi:Fe-S-cluster containining protein